MSSFFFFFTFLLGLHATAIFAWHTTNFGYIAVCGNLDTSAQDGPSSLKQKLISGAH